MRVAMAQVSMLNNMNENYKKTLQYIEKAQNADLLFFPQLQLSPYFPMMSGLDASVALSRESDARLRGIAYQAQKHHMCISPNVYLDDHGKQYCASLWFDKNGASHGVSGMVQLYDRKYSHDEEYYRPANSGFIVHDAGNAKVGIVIGNDIHFPESVRCCALRGAQLVIVPSAVTDHDDAEMLEWELRVQAKQNHVFIALCNRCGKEGRLQFCGSSLVVGPDGSVIARAGKEEELMKVDLDLSKAGPETPYIQHRNPVFYGVLAQHTKQDV